MKISRNGIKKIVGSKGVAFKDSFIKKMSLGVITISVIFAQGSIVTEKKCSKVSNQTITVEETLNKVAHENVDKPTSFSMSTNNIDNSVVKVEEKKVTNEKLIGLSYDDGPAKSSTLEILKTLKDNEATATFFILGNRVKKYADIITKIHDDGHEIGNHGYNHSSLTKLSNENIKKQIKDTSDAIFDVISEYPLLFRPPYGAYNKNVEDIVDYPFILWSIDSNDWCSITDQEVIDNIMSGLDDGKIILMHDIHKRTVNVSQTILPQIKAKGYKIVSISELFEEKDIELEKGHVYTKTKKVK